MLNCIDLWLCLYALQCSIIFVNVCMKVCVVKRLLAQVSLVQWTQFCLSCSYNFTVVSRSLIMWWCTFTSKVSTRLGMQHSVFGQPSGISEAQLPTKETVFRCYLWYISMNQRLLVLETLQSWWPLMFWLHGTKPAFRQLSVVHETNSVDTLAAVLCDSTNVNTGEHNGVIRQLEIALKRPVQWLICMLHLNELPFREVFKTVDGPWVSE